jgi:hypothetical protein
MHASCVAVGGADYTCGDRLSSSGYSDELCSNNSRFEGRCKASILAVLGSIIHERYDVDEIPKPHWQGIPDEGSTGARASPQTVEFL